MTPQKGATVVSPLLVKLLDCGVEDQPTPLGTIVVKFRTQPQHDPRPAVDEFHASREQWIALAKELLRQLDPVERDEVPLLLKRIAEALE